MIIWEIIIQIIMYVIHFKNYNVLKNISRSVVVPIEYYSSVYSSNFFQLKDVLQRDNGKELHSIYMAL